MMSTSTSGSSSRMSTCTSGFTQPSAISPRLSSSSNGWHCQSINEPPFAVQFYGVSTIFGDPFAQHGCACLTDLYILLLHLVSRGQTALHCWLLTALRLGLQPAFYGREHG